MSAVEPKSLVLITVDCLRADHTGFMGYSRPTTPFLDQLALVSFMFPKAIVTGAPTYFSFPGLMASRYPLSLGREVIGIAPGEPTLATALRDAGYQTAAFVATNPYLSQRFGYEQGFDVFQDFASSKTESASKDSANGHARIRTRVNQQISKLAHKADFVGRVYDELYFQYCQRLVGLPSEGWESLRCFPSADVVVDQVCTWLDASGRQPFFLWLHLMDPHAPYYPPTEALATMGATDIRPQRGRYLNETWKRGNLSPERLRRYRDEIVCLYDAGIRWVDVQVERLVEFLRARALWESSLLVLTADHGEEFLDHGGTFHPPSRTFQELLHVPLVIRMPGVQRKLSAAPFSLLHLAPTILDAIGIHAPPEFEGRSFWPEMQSRGGWDLAISESVGSCTNPMDRDKRLGNRILVVQDERYKLILSFESGAENLYDLQTDPHEQHALPQAADRSARARLLRAALDHLARQRSSSEPDRRLRAMIREIGLELGHSKTHTETLVT